MNGLNYNDNPTSFPLGAAIKGYCIIVDTSFAMQESFGLFLESYKSELERNLLHVPYRVLQELETIIGRNDDSRLMAVKARLLISQAVERRIAVLHRDEADDNIINDAVISRVVEGLLPTRDVLALTHDKNLSTLLYDKTTHRCFRVKDLIVAGVGREGRLFAWRRPDTDAGTSAPARFRAAPRNKTAALPGPAPFAPSAKLADSLGKRLTASGAVGAGDALQLKDGGRIVLRRELASGGEGAIYELDDPLMLCKVYHPGKLTLDRQEKIELMLTRKVAEPGVCWPRAAVYDSESVFRGFIMPRAPKSAVPLGHGLFIPAGFRKTHPSWTRLDSTQMALAILEKIKYLHRLNVLLGDINPLNILVNDDGNVFLVDCDSFQIQGYPCPVGFVNFTAAEIQRTNFGTFLRKKEHELFSVATLLFMIFMPGKSPYSHQGGADGAANIRKMHFPYPLKERRADGAPEGPWRLCWSHLSSYMKVAFNRCFHEDHRGEPRVSIEQWMQILGNYAYALGKNDAAFHGPEQKIGFDLSIFPENYQRILKDGEIQPPWPEDGLTDRERMIRRLVQKAPSPYSSHANTFSAAVSNTGNSGHASHANPLPQGVAPPATPNSSKFWFPWKYVVGGVVVLAIAGTAFVRAYWGPIIEVVKITGCIIAAVVILFAITALFSKK